MSDARTEELRSRLANLHARITHAAEASGRSPSAVTLVVVTKTWPVVDLRRLFDLGVRDLGENRHQEAETKATELAGLGISWHFVGQVQSNKAARIATYADVVHSVDSVRVAERLNAGADQADRLVSCLVQVSLDVGEHHPGDRGGVAPAQVDEVAAVVSGAGRLRLAGVMAVAPRDVEPARAFERLTSISSAIQAVHPDATWMSAGMTGDFEAAISAGATHVRVGSAILGERPLLR